MTDKLFTIAALPLVGTLLAMGWYVLFEVYPRVVLAAIDIYALRTAA